MKGLRFTAAFSMVEASPSSVIFPMEKKMSARSGFSVLALSLGLVVTGIGCRGNNQNSANEAQTQNAVATQAANESQDPAEQANLAPAVNTTGTAQQQTAPSRRSENRDYDYNAPEAYEPATYAPDPPPPLPDYDQPEAPGPDYIWAPGYWNYANTGYYWVPGAWVMAPYTGALWTPGYWGYYNDRYAWHRGYWGPHIGFYGGVNYGYGYTGVGYVGGYWNNGTFLYNTAITRVNPSTVHNTYSRRVQVVTNRRISYNGGRGGITTRPLTAERIASGEQHMAPLPAQMTHRERASKNRFQWASQNHGRPQTMVVSQPLNYGRHAPPPMPQQVQAQVQHERGGNPPAPRTPSTNSPHPENRPGQPQIHNQPRNQMRPAENNHAAPRTENQPANHSATRNEARSQAQRSETHTQTHTRANHPEARTQPHTQARSTQHTATAAPQSRSTTRPETRHSTNGRDHTPNHEERRQPRNSDHNPQL